MCACQRATSRPSMQGLLTRGLAVTPDEESRYTAIIDNILQTADLNTVTRKKIRLGLEEALDGKDLGDQKVRRD